MSVGSSIVIKYGGVYVLRTVEAISFDGSILYSDRKERLEKSNLLGELKPMLEIEPVVGQYIYTRDGRVGLIMGYNPKLNMGMMVCDSTDRPLQSIPKNREIPIRRDFIKGIIEREIQ